MTLDRLIVAIIENNQLRLKPPHRRLSHSLPLFIEDYRTVLIVKQCSKKLKRFRRSQVDFIQYDPIAVDNRFGQCTLKELERELVARLFDVFLNFARVLLQLEPFFVEISAGLVRFELLHGRINSVLGKTYEKVPIVLSVAGLQARNKDFVCSLNLSTR